ncbi:MAG TPA: hypothetical protein DCZ92_11960 [Elusimicrobia bacterium]|nr:MAG: hypothetical protein A2016_01505 [Elusimicrobia bacterium GWF2_62_30]HBA61505.1 hypothetical protein [Elusimicrobiota bacterium]
MTDKELTTGVSWRRGALSVLGALLFYACWPGAGASYAAFDDLGFGARAPGMGDAFSAVADDVSSVYYNPAGLSVLERPKAMASHSMLYNGLSDGSNIGLSAAAFTVPLSAGNGVLGVSWQQLQLSGVYFEKTAGLAWGYRFPEKSPYRKFSVGASLKYLNHGFTRLDEAYNAVENDMLQYGSADPVLAGSNSKSAFDADAGLLYRVNKRWTVGAAAHNLLQADVAFSGADKDPVPMKTSLGASYKSLWTVLSCEARLQKAPGGGADNQFIAAAEKIYPSLDKGDVGVRGSLGAGTNDFRQFTAGLSYKIQKIQFDYAFLLPLGTIKDTAGTHKLALTYHFGSATAAEATERELLDQQRQVEATREYKSPGGAATLNDPRLAEVKTQADAGNYAAAHKLLLEKAGDLLPDTSVVDLSRRLATVAAFYPALAPAGSGRERWAELLFSATKDLIAGADTRAMRKLAYAQSLNQRDTVLSNFMDRAGELTRVTPDRVPADFGQGLVEYKIKESDDSYSKKSYPEALRRLEEALELEPSHLAALKKSGSCNYLLGNYARALANWEKALGLETDPEDKARISKMTDEARAKLGKPGGWEPPVEQPKAAEPPAPAPEAAVKPAQPGKPDAREIEKYYQAGADQYSKGDYGKAADNFRKILVLDPQNTQAKKALERIIRLSQ